MIPETILMIIGIALAILAVVTFFAKRPKKVLDKRVYRSKWRDLQKKLAKPDTWALAIIEADSLLDEVLKKRHFKGKTMGERLVEAQRSLTNNDSVWFGHKLRNQLVHQTDVPLRKNDVKQALLGFGQALKDLGAI